MNRISSMAGSGGSCTALNWTYDAWGNREDQTAPPGGGTCLQPQFTYLSNNQISGYGYDSAGNLTSQTGAAYTYDNENRLVATNSSGGNATYLYDASGRRVQKTVGSNSPTFYVYNKDGEIYAWLAPGGRQLGYVYMNGQVLAQYQYGTTYFHHHDHLGSTRLVSELNQVIEQCNGYYPFGETDNNQCTPTANNDFTDTLFTAKERDSESNLDNFEARYMASSLGRFMSPDWSAYPEPVPFADLGDPQTLNLYVYVTNNPLLRADLNGHGCDPDTSFNDNQGALHVVSGRCYPDFLPLMAAVGHHFIDQALIRAKDGWNSLAGQVFRRLTTGPLKPGGVHTGFSTAHRLNSEQIKDIVTDVENKTGRSFSEWHSDDIKQAIEEVKNAGGDVGSFLDQIASENPTARTIEQDTGAIFDSATKAYNSFQQSQVGQAVDNVIDDVEQACEEPNCGLPPP